MENLVMQLIIIFKKNFLHFNDKFSDFDGDGDVDVDVDGDGSDGSSYLTT
jgi:hypothetical protein